MRQIASRYHIDEEIPPRSGGMAEVYEAHDQNNRFTRVALKLFQEGCLDHKLLLEVFSRETQALAAISHNNIVKMLDWGTDENTGRKYLVLEWLDRDLKKYLSQKRIEGWDDYYEIIGFPILDALVHAYSKGMLHRDVKPNNILFDDDDTLKIVDFGISKIKRQYTPGVTLAAFASRPYSPPEADDGEFTETRDVYSFAVVTIECLCGKELENYDEILPGLNDCDLPQEIYDVLLKCIDKNPSERPSSILELSDAVINIQNRRSQYWKKKLVVRILFTRSFREKMSSEIPSLDEAELQSFVMNDLNDDCGIRLWQSGDDPGQHADGIHLSLLTAEFRYHAVVDREGRDRLALLNVFRVSSSFVVSEKDGAWQPSVEFKVGRPTPDEEAVRTLRSLIDGLNAHEADQRLHHRKEAEERVFRIWSSILNAKRDAEQDKEQPIAYTEASRVEGGLHLKTKMSVEEDVIGLPRLIRLPNGKALPGIIEYVDGTSIMFSPDRNFGDDVPSHGEIVIDTRAARTALHRQTNALDAVQFERSLRPDLKNLILNPQRCRAPKQLEELEFFSPNLDNDKKYAVAATMATDDVMIIEGPPGTGKTQFITELILQSLKSNPNTRILLSSQTHVALDNAIERIRKETDIPRIVRIARRNDARVSPKNRDLLLDNQAERWLAEVKKRTDRFLTEWANANSISRTDIEVGMAASRLRISKQFFTERSRRIEENLSILDSLRAQEKELESKSTSDTMYELKEKISSTEELIADLERDKETTLRDIDDAKAALSALGSDGQLLADMDAQELREWEDALLGETELEIKCKSLIELSEEWQLRFGRSTDFHAALILASELVAGTCIGFAGLRGIQNVEFDLCIVDEASKATATELLVPLSRSRKWVLVGDTRQLPPFIEVALRDPAFLRDYQLKPEDVSETLFDRFLNGVSESNRKMLKLQYRMVRPIGDLVSACFYDGELCSVREEINRGIVFGFGRPVVWISTSNLNDRREISASPSYKNLCECRQIVDILKRLEFSAKTTDDKYSVAILTGYVAQKSEIEHMVAGHEREFTHLNVEYNTVDAFQGREADVCIYSVTRSNEDGRLGFLDEKRRLNVALSRAKEAIIIVGDHLFCRNVGEPNPFNRVVSYFERNPSTCTIELAEK